MVSRRSSLSRRCGGRRYAARERTAETGSVYDPPLGYGVGYSNEGAHMAKRFGRLVLTVVLFGALAFSAYVYALGKLPVSTVATYAYVNPVIAVLLGALLAGESLSPIQSVGGLIVVAAVFVVVRAEAKAKQVPVEEPELVV